MMINLLLECSIFLHIDAGQGNYYQLSGKYLHDENTVGHVSERQVRAAYLRQRAMF